MVKRIDGFGQNERKKEIMIKRMTMHLDLQVTLNISAY